MTKEASSASHLKLPEVLDVTAAAALATQLQALRGQSLCLDASDVQRVGGLGLQVLLSAKLTWATERKHLAVVEPSPAFQEAVSLLGAASLMKGNA